VLRKAFLSGLSTAWRQEEGEGSWSVLQPGSPPFLASLGVGAGMRLVSDTGIGAAKPRQQYRAAPWQEKSQPSP